MGVQHNPCCTPGAAVAIDKEILAPSSYRKSVVVPMPGPSDALNKPKASTSNVYAQKVVVKQAGRVSFPVSHNALTLHSQHSCRYTTCPPEQHYQARKFVLRIRSGCMSQDLHGLSCPCLVPPAESHGRSPARHAKAEAAATRLPKEV